MSNYVIVGTGGHGRTVLSYLIRSGVSTDRIAFVDLFEKKTDEIADCQVIGDLSRGFSSPFEEAGFIVAYGGDSYSGNLDREKYSDLLKTKLDDRNSLISVVDKSAIVTKDVQIETNVSIGIGSFLGTNCKVREGVIINNRALIEHDVEIGEYSNVSPGAIILGGSRLGARVFVGAGAVLRDDISIGKDAIVGMGAVVTKHVSEKTFVAGNPARLIRTL